MKILVIEDDLKLASLLKKGLEASGHVVEVAHDATEGWRLATSGHSDVFVLDVKLPGMDGISLCAKLRNDGVQTPILMLTARDSVDDKVAGLTAGADDYLTKPFSFEELKARLIALVRRPLQFVETRLLTAGDLELDLNTSEARLCGIVIELTRREFAVLELLMRNTNQVLSREVLLDRVWGTDFDPSANVVDAAIARLRVKLNRDGERKTLIKTVRGLGYRIET